MPLSGKLILGFLQEDNPQKSYFRFKPLYIIEGNAHQAIDTGELYPEDGFIRIVPDKNEINHFKARMRGIGPLAALDLRKFADENNKIRPNKNYQQNGAELNAFIVYSDVIGLPPRHLCAEIVDLDALPGDQSLTFDARAPLTPLIALRAEGTIGGLWHWREAAERPGCVTVALCKEVSEPDEKPFAERALSLVLGDDTREVLLGLSDFGIDATAVKVQAPRRETEPVSDPPYSITTVSSGQSEPPEDAPKEEAPPATPWIHHDASIAPRPFSGKPTQRDHSLRAQTGINPRRNKSLSEVIDDKWRKSRIDQLGHPVPGSAMGVPAVSPIEQAVEAVKAAWHTGGARSGLMDELLKNEGFVSALRDALGITGGGVDARSEEALNELEAARLRILSEIDQLKAKRGGIKESLLTEVRAEYKSEMDALEKRSAALRHEVESAEAEAETALRAAQVAEHSIDELFGDKFDEKLAESVAQSRAKKLIRRSGKPKASIPGGVPKVYDPSPEDLIGTVYAGLIGAGFSLTRFDVINLLAALTVGEMIVLSGEPGSGKTALARALAAALGLCAADAKRFVKTTSLPDKEVEQLMLADDGLTFSLAFVDDLNAACDASAQEKLIALLEKDGADALRAMAAVQDAPDGRPLSARLLDRAFFVRISPPSANWAGGELMLPAPERAISLSALKRAFGGERELPDGVEEKLASIRAALSGYGWRMSYRTVREIRRYCAAVLPYREEAPLELLDLAIAQRALPAMLAALEWNALCALPEIFKGFKHCEALMSEPLPVPPVE